ncbi:competence type IV pilus minor pilin ComGG [Cytobacillus sp. IB215316]|uniref:competence type IV pilus minor pilin ComGG n=1 Tax=Cytobacillus sp. IB215316 TaxID=3097354 RepID=UPI002A109B31|nr:competence type IV pilus minor pilin ComGG [Cytobacillus sp. IB215316]MDX8359614.1 competence type IV pilus minor pilin ComGG [Cytobacillus sp. IB215316]
MKKNNEHGFIFPVTLVMSLLFFLVLLHQIEMYVVEKNFYHEIEQLYILENIMQMATTDILKDIHDNAHPIRNKIYTYPNGQAMYSKEQIEEGMLKISIECKTIQKRLYNAFFIYELEEGRIIKWVENR